MSTKQSNGQNLHYQAADSAAAVSFSSWRWRPVDIAVTAGLSVASGVLFWGFNYVSAWIFPLMTAILPGLASLLHAFWYFTGPLALLIIRKPGAAIFVNVAGSIIEMLLGNQYPFSLVLVDAALQGLFAEIAFAVFGYRRWTLGVTVFSGALVAVEYGLFLLFFYFQGVSLFSARGLIHMTSEIIGGVLIAGVMSWYLYVAIARTGALDRFASGRELRGIAD